MSQSAIYVILSALPFLVCLLWTVTILLDHLSGRSKKSAGTVLVLFAAVATLLYFCHFLHFNQLGDSFDLQDCVWCFCTLAVYPVFGLWLSRLTSTAPVKPLLFIPAFGPSVLAFITGLILYINDLNPRGLFLAIRCVFVLQVGYTLFYGISSLKRYRGQIANLYADTEGKQLRSVGTMLVLLLITSLASSVFNIIGREVFVGNSLIVIPSLLFSVLLFAILWLGHLPVFDASVIREDFSAQEEENGDAADADVLLEKILAVMREERLYMKKGLKISDLALAVGSNRTYVSNCINRKVGMSFSDFVGRFRVKAAMDILTAVPSGGGVEAAGWKAGFSSRSQFYRSFKKETGLTPGEWLSKR